MKKNLNEWSFSIKIRFDSQRNTWIVQSTNIEKEFHIGSKITEKDIGFKPNNFDDFRKHSMQKLGFDKFLTMDYQYVKIYNKTSSKILDRREFQPGKGEWQAETIEDARKMALDTVDNLTESLLYSKGNLT